MNAPTLDALVSTLSGYAYRFFCEADLQQGVAAALTASAIPFTREAQLGEYGRIDFLVGRVGIEVKSQGSISLLTRQLCRYAECPDLDALLLLTPAQRLANLPETLNGKPLRAVVLLESCL